MNTIKSNLRVPLIILAMLFSAIGWSQYGMNPPETWHYAIEINEVLCGFSESNLTTIENEGKTLWQLNDDILVRQSVLGGGVDLSIKNHIILDPESMSLLSIERLISTTADIYSFSKFDNGKVLYRSAKEAEFKEMNLEPDVILENTLVYPHLLTDFIRGNETEKSYRVYDDMRFTIIEKKYTRIGEEKIVLADKEYDAIVLDEFNSMMGTTTRLWLDKTNSYALKINIQNRVIYLSDKSAKKRIQVVDLDNILFAKVDKMIPNVPDISYMKVSAKIQSAGELLNTEQLNFEGQSFAGTVVDNFIDGVFEMEAVRYDGKNANPFPFTYPEESLQKYLEPENLIESDEAVLISEAKRITKDASDSWDASVKLSKWVAENIKGAVPGGTSAINTYHTREGECGSHSRLLVAFCRAVGIPSRLSVGCMYSPYMGGTFGQHAWTEVYMGEAGWIAVDATAFEYDFIDAGHIRLGENSTFNPKEMKILEYKLLNNEVVEDKMPRAYEKYLGKYIIEGTDRVFYVKIQNTYLAVDIPGQNVLVLNEPDDEGIFYPQMTRQVNFTFEEDENGEVSTMKLQQILSLQKRGALDKPDEPVPDEYLELVGKYWMSMAQAEFSVFHKEGELYIKDPLSNSTVRIERKEDSERWIDEFGKNEVMFDRGSEGQISGFTIFSNVYLKKLDVNL